MPAKITEIPITRYRTSYEKDKYGNRKRVRTPYKAMRKVKVVAGGRRVAHYFIDSFIFSLLLVPFDLVYPTVGYIPNSLFGVPFAILFPASILYVLYYFGFESLIQTTPGKFLTGTVVINEYGQKPTPKQSIVRSLVRLVPFERLSCLLNDRGWHDTWSGTWVVRKAEAEKLLELMAE